MEFLGWYTIGGNPTKEDVDFHEQVVLNDGLSSDCLPVRFVDM